VLALFEGFLGVAGGVQFVGDRRDFGFDLGLFGAELIEHVLKVGDVLTARPTAVLVAEHHDQPDDGDN